MKKLLFIISVVFVGLGVFWGLTNFYSENESDKMIIKSPVTGVVTLIDFGAGFCVPCKLMAPILEEVRNNYKDRASIIFIDISRDREKISLYKIHVMPTQIFFDESGTEIMRHEGFMDKLAITTQLKKMGVR